MLKQARPCAGELDTRAMVYITLNDYANLGKTAGLESGLRRSWGGTHIGPLDCCCHAAATLRDATRVMTCMRHVYRSLRHRSPHSTLPLTRRGPPVYRCPSVSRKQGPVSPWTLAMPRGTKRSCSCAVGTASRQYSVNF